MVAGDTNIAYVSATCTLRIPLLCRGIADQQVGLLSGNGVRSTAQLKTKTALDGVGSTVSPGPNPLCCDNGKGLIVQPTQKRGPRLPVLFVTGRSAAPLVRGDAR